MFVQEVLVVDLEEPVIPLVLLQTPVTEVLPGRSLLFSLLSFPSLLALALILLSMRLVRFRVVMGADLGLLEAFLVLLSDERVLLVRHGRAGINSTD